MIRLGLLGAGRWGRTMLSTLPRVTGVKLTRIGSRNPESARLMKGSSVHEDWREVVKAPDVDAVLVATPPPLHATMVATALAAGKPVFVEKPLTLDPSEARELLRLAEHLKGLVLVDHIYLFHPAYQALRRRVRAGRLKAIRSTGGNHGPFRKETRALWDYGAHDVALCLDLAGKPLSVGAKRLASRRMLGGSAENVEFRLEFPGGVQAVCIVGNLFEKKTRTLEAELDDETLVFDDLAEDQLMRRGADGKEEVLPAPRGLPLTVALQSFAEAVRSGSRDLESLRLGVEVVETLAMAEAALGHC